jgi:hypothetical protein
MVPLPCTAPGDVCYNIEHQAKVQGTKKTEVHMHVLQHRAPDEGPRDQENRSAPEYNKRSPPKAQQKHDTSIEHKTKYYGTRQNRLLRVLHVSCGTRICVLQHRARDKSVCCYIEHETKAERADREEEDPAKSTMQPHIHVHNATEATHDLCVWGTNET